MKEKEEQIKKEKVILMAICPQKMEEEVDHAIDELEALAETAGATTLVKVIQNREKAHPATYVGKGKVEEIKEIIDQYEVDTLICDDELTPAQVRNLTNELQVKVIDRPILIMDIFAKHAHTSEGILQVEMAQLKYRLSRLAGLGLGESMSRLGGGIGTRGPGEKKLEKDRRYIRRRMDLLKKELEKVHSNRQILRDGRKRQGKPIVAIVGYTNAGKSTLLNKLTKSDVLEADQLFATLDTTTRNLVLPRGKEVLLVDTVGFIRKLPHQIVEAFRSTLEEVTYADLLIHVVDATNIDVTTHMGVVHQTLKELSAEQIPVLTVLNKFDKPEANQLIRDGGAFRNIQVSALTGEGLPQMLDAIEEALHAGKIFIKVMIPYEQGDILQKIRTYGEIVEEKYVNEGIYVEAYLEKAYVDKYALRTLEG